jgi:hypothetical protein
MDKIIASNTKRSTNVFWSAIGMIIIAVFIAFNLHNKDGGNIFSKKEECFKYQNQIVNFVKTQNQTNKTNLGSHDFYVFHELFYSPKVDSCLYVMQTSYDDSSGGTFSAWGIDDILSNQTLVSTTTYFALGHMNVKSYTDTLNWFTNTVKDYG